MTKQFWGHIRSKINGLEGNRRVIYIGANSIVVWAGFLGLQYVSGHDFFQWFWPIAFLISAISMKIYTPKVPWWQVLVALALIVSIHYGMEYLAFEGHLTIALCAIDLILSIVMWVIGKYWRSKGYVTAEQASID